MVVTLVDIIGVKPEWETHHRVRALAVGGSSDVLEGLKRLKDNHPKEYKKIFRIFKNVAENERVKSPNHVKQGKIFRHVYEMRAGHSRFFFFYTPDTEEVVVCTNHYWKAKDSKKEQDAGFKRSEMLRQVYLASIGSEF